MKERLNRRRFLTWLLLGAVAVAASIVANVVSGGYGRGSYGFGGYGR